MYILLVFFILALLITIFILNLNIKLFVKIKSNRLISYIKRYFINIPLFKFKIKNLLKKNNKENRSYSEYLLIKDILKKNFIKLERFKLQSEISVADPILTAITVMGISTVIAILIKYYNIKINYNNYKYIINPIYADKIILNVQLDSIIKINLVHIMYIFYKKWRRDLNGRKASNRKPYDDCYEQHKRDDRC